MSVDNVVPTGTGALAATATQKATDGVVFSVTITPAAADASLSITNAANTVTFWNGLARAGGVSISHTFPQGMNCPGGIRCAINGVGMTYSLTYA